MWSSQHLEMPSFACLPAGEPPSSQQELPQVRQPVYVDDLRTIVSIWTLMNNLPLAPGGAGARLESSHAIAVSLNMAPDDEDRTQRLGSRVVPHSARSFPWPLPNPIFMCNNNLPQSHSINKQHSNLPSLAFLPCQSSVNDNHMASPGTRKSGT